MNKKKVAIVINNAFGYAGTENACNFMVECFSDVSCVDVISLSGNGETFYPFNDVNNIISLEKYKFPTLALYSILKKNSYSTVFVVGMGGISVKLSWLILLLKAFNIPSQFYACEHVSFSSFSTVKKIVKLLSFVLYNKIIVLTQKDKVLLSRFLKKVCVIQNPVKYKGGVRQNYGKTVLAVGRLTYQKGFDQLIDIWSEFSTINPDWKLVIAGDGELESELKLLSEQRVKNGSVHFYGRVSDVNSLYKTSDYLVMTSRYEGLPMVLLEAKSWGLPAIAFDCPTGPAEIISEGNDGFLIKNGDKTEFLNKMLDISSDPAMFKKLQENTIETSKPFSPESIKKQWRSLL